MKLDSRGDWIEKAEHDFIAAKLLARQRAKPVNDVVCYHCQQCIEKYLKAILTAGKIPPPKTHDLMQLIDLAATQDSSIELIRDLIKPLSEYAIHVRYPGDEPTKAEAKHALRIAEDARQFLRNRL